MRFVLILFILFQAHPLFAQDLRVLTHSLQGQAKMIDGQLRGKEGAGKRAFNLELVREIVSRLGKEFEIEEVPFKRGLQMAQKGTNIAFFNVSRTPAREKSVKWVGPLQIETDYLYEMINRPTGITTLEEAKKVQNICVLNGNVHHEKLEFLGFQNLVMNTSYVNCFKMLKAGRVNLTPSASSTVDKKLLQAGIKPEDVKQTPAVVASTEGSIAFSNNVANSEIQQWQQALDEIKADGTYNYLLKKYQRIYINQ